VRAAARQIGFPVMLRGGFALGGQGSGIVETEADLDQALRRIFANGVTTLGPAQVPRRLHAHRH
jgi:carbamoylphosphate synthase large subunit